MKKYTSSHLLLLWWALRKLTEAIFELIMYLFFIRKRHRRQWWNHTILPIPTQPQPLYGLIFLTYPRLYRLIISILFLSINLKRGSPHGETTQNHLPMLLMEDRCSVGSFKSTDENGRLHTSLGLREADLSSGLLFSLPLRSLSLSYWSCLSPSSYYSSKISLK